MLVSVGFRRNENSSVLGSAARRRSQVNLSKTAPYPVQVSSQRARDITAPVINRIRSANIRAAKYKRWSPGKARTKGQFHG